MQMSNCTVIPPMSSARTHLYRQCTRSLNTLKSNKHSRKEPASSSTLVANGKRAEMQETLLEFHGLLRSKISSARPVHLGYNKIIIQKMPSRGRPGMHLFSFCSSRIVAWVSAPGSGMHLLAPVQFPTTHTNSSQVAPQPQSSTEGPVHRAMTRTLRNHKQKWRTMR